MLVDGTVAATWTITTTPGEATLTVRCFRALSGPDLAEVEAEGLALLAFLHPTRTPNVQHG